MTAPAAAPRVCIVAGGLAGLAAAVALAEAGCQVQLFEARRSLGGRAGSFTDPDSGEAVDHCQHVSMGCCTNLADFCRRTGTEHLFRRDRVLHFIGPDARSYRLARSWCPAPGHLAPAFLRLGYLSLGDRLRIGAAMWKLARMRPGDGEDVTVAEWLQRQRQSAAAIERFWSVILVSALGESLDRASLAAARKVMADGFLSARDGYEVLVPEAPLGQLYGEPLERWFAERGVELHAGTPVERVSLEAGQPHLQIADRSVRCDFAVLAVPWTRLAALVDPALAATWPWFDGLSQVGGSPITGVHLWFDRPIMELPHAVLVGRLSQWVFHRAAGQGGRAGEHYYQVVISASRRLAGRAQREIVDQVQRELASVWPAAREAKLLRARVVTQQAAVFSVRPGLDRWRPPQQTPTPGIVIAGDWTATGWPSTMEGAVRSGYLAAEAVLHAAGRPRRFLVDDLPRGWLARLLVR